jgi:hypothetical protein
VTLSRRDFLGAGTASLVNLALFPSSGVDDPARSEDDFDCVLIDLKSDCVLRESFQGYRATLSGKDACTLQISADSQWRSRLAIVPGAALMDATIAQRLAALLRTGTRLVLESGGAFLSHAGFIEHQRIVERYFELALKPPIDLWAATLDRNELAIYSRKRYRGEENGRKQIPYVTYSWPENSSVRDFSRVIPVAENAGEIIGRMGILPVALKKRLGDGALIFLGSPLGPALLAGDPEARAWLKAATRI